MSGNILFLGNKIFEVPPFFQTLPGGLGEKVHACSLRFFRPEPSALYLETLTSCHDLIKDKNAVTAAVSLALWRLDREKRRRLILRETGFTR